MNKLEQAKLAIHDLYEKYKDQGFLSVYIWGSILTDDFDPETSDVDTVAIVEDNLPLGTEEKMMTYVRENYEGLKDFYVRFLYLGELNGERPRAPLASVINPRILLLQMSDWLHVIGKDYTNKDFKLVAPDYHEAVQLHISKIKNDGWDIVENVPKHFHVVFMKTLMRLIDTRQKARGAKTGIFSYNTVFNESLKSGDDLEKGVTRAMTESRESGWKEEVFLKNKPVYQNFIDSLATH